MSDTDQAGNLGGQLSGGQQQGQPQGQPQENPWQIGGRSPWATILDRIRPPQGQPRLPIYGPDQQAGGQPQNVQQSYIPAQMREPGQWGQPDSILEGARAYPGITPGPHMPVGPVQIHQAFRSSVAGLANMGSGMVAPFGAASAAYQTNYLKGLMQGQEWRARMEKYQMDLHAAKLEQEQERESQEYGEAFELYKDSKDPEALKTALSKIANDRQDDRMQIAIANGGVTKAKELQGWRDHHYLTLAKTRQQIADTEKAEAEAAAAKQDQTDRNDQSNQLPPMPSPGAPQPPQGQSAPQVPQAPQIAQRPPIGAGYDMLQPTPIRGAPQQPPQAAGAPQQAAAPRPQPPGAVPGAPAPEAVPGPPGAVSPAPGVGQPPPFQNAPVTSQQPPTSVSGAQPAQQQGPQPFSFLPPLTHDIYGQPGWQIDQWARNYNKYGTDALPPGKDKWESARNERINETVRRRAGQMSYAMDTMLQQLPPKTDLMTGINLVNSIDPGLAAEVKSIISYKQPMKDTGSMHGYWAKMKELVTRLDPSWEENGYAQANRVKQSFSGIGGPNSIGARVIQGNRLLTTIGQLLAETENLKNRNFVPFNSARNAIRGAQGDAVLTNWNNLHNDMAAEADQFLRNRSAITTYKAIRDQMNAARTPAEIQGYLKILADQVASQFNAFGDFYNKETRADGADRRDGGYFLNDQSKGIYRTLNQIPFPGGVPKEIGIVHTDAKGKQTVQYVPRSFEVSPDLGNVGGTTYQPGEMVGGFSIGNHTDGQGRRAYWDGTSWGAPR